jgi:hypothetical protein
VLSNGVGETGYIHTARRSHAVTRGSCGGAQTFSTREWRPRKQRNPLSTIFLLKAFGRNFVRLPSKPKPSFQPSHVCPVGDAIVVNPEISSGLPIAGINRYPPPGSRPEKYSTPATKGIVILGVCAPLFAPSNMSSFLGKPLILPRIRIGRGTLDVYTRGSPSSHNPTCLNSSCKVPRCKRKSPDVLAHQSLRLCPTVYLHPRRPTTRHLFLLHHRRHQSYPLLSRP